MKKHVFRQGFLFYTLFKTAVYRHGGTSMDVLEKLTILTDSAKYDVACTSSGSERPATRPALAALWPPGCAMPLRLTAGASAC